MGGHQRPMTAIAGVSGSIAQVATANSDSPDHTSSSERRLRSWRLSGWPPPGGRRL